MADDVNFGLAKTIDVDTSSLHEKKYVMPEIAPEDMVPEMAELVAFAEQLTKEANAAYEKKNALEKELARLIKARKRASRLAK